MLLVCPSPFSASEMGVSEPNQAALGPASCRPHLEGLEAHHGPSGPGDIPDFKLRRVSGKQQVPPGLILGTRPHPSDGAAVLTSPAL